MDHIYTGERIGVLDVPGAVFKDVLVSNDGSRLYVLNGVPDSVVAVADLDNAWGSFTDVCPHNTAACLLPAAMAECCTWWNLA